MSTTVYVVLGKFADEPRPYVAAVCPDKDTAERWMVRYALDAVSKQPPEYWIDVGQLLTHLPGE